MGYQENPRTTDYTQWSNEELLEEYKRTSSQVMKQELAKRYIYVVRSIAIQMRDVYIGFSQLEDIIQEGVITVMSAIDKFELEKNVKFETYISKRIRGMIIDLARKQDWIPRTVRKNVKDLEQATAELFEKLGRTPSTKEVVAYMGITEEKYQKILAKTNLFHILSLDMVIEENSENPKVLHLPSVEDEEQPEQSYLNKEFHEVLEQSILKLKENEQKVIALYYVEELNMKEIAKIMQVSEPRISQIHAHALKKLKEYIEQYNQ